MDTAQPGKSTDSMYSSDGTSYSKDYHDNPTGSSNQDDLSQLKTKRNDRSRLARQPPGVSSDLSDNDSISQIRSRKPGESPQKSTNLKRRRLSVTSSEESNNVSQIETCNTKRRTRRQSPGSSDDATNSRKKNKHSTKRLSNSSEESSDVSQTRKTREKTARQQSPESSDDSINSLKNNKYSSLSDDATNSPLEKKKKRSKARTSSGTNSSEESNDVSQTCKRNTKRRKSSCRATNSSENEYISGTEYASFSENECIPDTEYASFSENEYIFDTEYASSSETSISEAESDSSQGNKSNVTPKKARKSKYKNLRNGGDSPDEEEKDILSSSECPRINENVHVLNYIYKKLVLAVACYRPEKVHDIIYGSSYVQLTLPKFSGLLWQVVTSSSKKAAADIAKLLVEAGVDVNLKGPNEHSMNTVLHVVAEKASREYFEQLAFSLMSHGANINACNGDGDNVLWSAVKGGSLLVVEELMRREVEVGNQYNRVLRVAAENMNSSSVKILPLLVEYKALDMDTKDNRAMHALRCLVKAGGNLDAMRVLLDYILPLNDIDEEGLTLLYRSVMDSKFEMVKLLLEYGANPRMKRRDGKLPLWCAARQETSKIAGLLIKHGASVHDCNIDGQYPIHVACHCLSTENIRLLLHFGAEVNVTECYFALTPFSMANHQSFNDALKLMIQQFALLTSKHANINKGDLIKIRAYPEMRKYYAQCLCELEKMKRLKIFEDISVYSILNCDIKKISHLIRNYELIEEYHKNLKEITTAAPIFSLVLQKRMKIAWLRRDKLLSIEAAIQVASNNVLTDDVCEKIAYFACYECLMDFDLKQLSSS